MPLLVSFVEVLWYVFFISSGLLFCICIALFVLHLLRKKNDSNKYDEEDLMSPSSNEDI